MEIYKNKYVKCDYFKETSHLEITWTYATIGMSDLEYKTETLKLAELIEQYRPSKLLHDNTETSFIVTPELQEWTNLNVIKRTVEAGLKTSAIVLCNEIIIETSIKQTYEENIAKQKTTNMFTTKEEALKWLLSV